MYQNCDTFVKNKVFNIKTRNGRIIKIVREQYLRNDIVCGIAACLKCKPFRNIQRLQLFLPENFQEDVTQQYHILVPDTNLLIHHLNLFEYDMKHNLVIMQTALNELKSKYYSNYKRICGLIFHPDRNVYTFANEYHHQTYLATVTSGYTTNDRNDAALRKAVKWYTKHCSCLPFKIIFLTNDKRSLEIALEEGIYAYTLEKYICEYAKNKDELLNKMGNILTTDDFLHDLFDKNHKIHFPDHLDIKEIEKRVAQKKLVQGVFSVNYNNYLEAEVHVSSSTSSETIAIHGLKSQNRAIHGDIVACEILPESEWVLPSSVSQFILEDEEEAEELDVLMAKNEHDTETRNSQPINSNNLQKTGRIVGIIKRKWKPIAGYIQLPIENDFSINMGNWYTFIPLERRIPRVRIPINRITFESQLITERDANDILKSKIIVVSIDSWPKNSRHPLGHYIRTLGSTTEAESFNLAILLQYDIQPIANYPLKALKCLPPSDWSVLSENLEKRLDLRNELIMSIDPPGCTDVDDALHCKFLENGNIQIGVHIADVTHFVKTDTPLDLEARNRGTTVYLVDRRIEMLPALLSSDICSLLADKDRLTFSVLWEVDPLTSEIIKSEVAKTIIRSSAKLTYEEGQNLLDAYVDLGVDKILSAQWKKSSALMAFADNPKLAENPELLYNLSKSIYFLNTITKKLKAKRLEQGALILSSNEMKFLMDSETNEPVTLTTKQNYATNSLVEEMMLLANITVAKIIYNHFPNLSVLRNHATPSPSNFDQLTKAAAILGISLDIHDGKTLASSLNDAENYILHNIKFKKNAPNSKQEENQTKTQKAMTLLSASEPETPYLITLLRILTSRCMTEALYFNSGSCDFAEYFHYGLSTPIYTHFTSPIRRYADILVHRILAATLGITMLDSSLRNNPSLLQNICDHLNLRNRNARNAQRASFELQIQLYFKDRIVEDWAYIIGVRKNAIRVLVPKFGVEGSIYIKSIENTEKVDKDLIFDEENEKLIYTPSDQSPSYPIVLKCFDCVFVRLALQSTLETKKYIATGFHSVGNKLVIRLLDPYVPHLAPESFDQKNDGNKKRIKK